MQSVHHSLSHTLWDGDATAELHMHVASWHCRYNTQQYSLLFLSLRFNGHFPGEPGLASVCWSKGWWRWWWQLDYWSYKSCKAPVTSSPPTNQHPVFYRLDALPVPQPTVSKHWREKISMDLLTPSSPGVFQLCLWPLKGSWLPWGWVAMPLISPLMPIPQIFTTLYWWIFCVLYLQCHFSKVGNAYFRQLICSIA